MERLNNYKYSYTKTINLEISKQFSDCLIDINSLAKQEGYKGSDLFNDEVVLNLDCIEKKKAKKKNIDNSMDFTIITKQNKKTDKALLVDFKLNAKSGKNIEKANIEKKLKYSKGLLTEFTTIHNFSILIYNHKFVKEANYTLRRIFYNKPTIIAITINELRDKIF